MAATNIAAAASSAVRTVLGGPPQAARLLGASAAAIYLATSGEPGAIAVLAHDAVRLPCGVLLPTTRAELPLTAIGPVAGAAGTIGGGRLSWPGRDGPVIIEAVREWAPARVGTGRPVAAAVQAARAALPDCDLGGVTAGQLEALRAGDAAALVGGLLGRGPGLTPSGDDLLASLLGCLASGLDAAPLRRAVAARAPVRTTALSAALLWHAARGECISEVAALAAALTGLRSAPAGQTGLGSAAAGLALAGHEAAARTSTSQTAVAVRRLLAVGHTSGAALALGLVLAAESR